MTTRKITLTDRPPVRIVEEEWSVVAHVSDFSGEHKFQANVVAWLKVRRHADGRTIVHGYRGAGDGGQGIGYSDWSGGYLLPTDASAADVVRAIHDVGAGIAEHTGYGSIDADAMVRNAIASLPAETI